MGNQSSHESQRKKEELRIKQLLGHLSVKEQDKLTRLFTTENIPTNTFTQQLPTGYEPMLAQAFQLYIQSRYPTTIQLGQVLDMLQLFLHGATIQETNYTNTAKVFLKLYTVVAEKEKVSVTQFVDWVVGTGVRLWFETSGQTWIEDDAKQRQRLVNSLLYFGEQQQSGDDLYFLQDEPVTNKDADEKAASAWSQQVQEAPYAANDQDIISWFERTPGIKILFERVVRGYFFGSFVIDEIGDTIYQERIRHLQSPQLSTSTSLGLLSAYDYFYLSLSLPANALSWSSHERLQRRRPVDKDLNHEKIFSSQRDGNSWQVFVHSLISRPGATLLVIRTKDGSLFGGYADDYWRLETDWYGSSFNFLFQLADSSTNMMGIWPATSHNRHYQYLCWGKKSLTNGLGMGGQLGYAGLWVEADFINGHSKGPICSTYQSPPLCSKQAFEIDQVEVWLVRPLQRDDADEEGGTNSGSILDRNEDMEFLEMSGKKLYSRDLEKPSPNQEQSDK